MKIQKYRFEISLVKYDHYTIYNACRNTFQVSSRWGQRVLPVTIFSLYRGLVEAFISRKFNDIGLRYRASNMITIPYISVEGGRFKSEIGEVRVSSPLLFSGGSEGW